MLNIGNYLFGILFSKDRHFYKIVRELFGIYANNIELYKLALIHKSASIKLDDGTIMNNERLEFLGDAVIESVVSDMIYIEFPYENEGVLTQLRSKIVSRSSLNYISEKIGLSENIIAQANLPSTHRHMAGDAFEAMIGAIYLDKGYDFANRLLINNIFAKYIDLESINEMETDFKSRLIEWCQRHRVKPIMTSTQNRSFHGDDDHNYNFQCEIVIGNKRCFGVGDSKKEAEQRAAKNMIEKLPH